MINIKILQQFLVEAKKATYASGNNAPTLKEADGSTTLVFEKGEWSYHDNYFGGEPYGGREVVFFQNKPIYIMVYYGYIYNGNNNIKEIYSFLQKALTEIPEQYPFRGPQNFQSKNMIYENSFSGEVDSFFGTEIIKQDGQEIYQARYMGGFVNQQ